MPSGVGFLFGGLDVVNLTPKQEKFAQCVADGMTQADAYRTAYDCKPTTKPESIQDSASKLMRDARVLCRVDALRQAAIECWLKRQVEKIDDGFFKSQAKAVLSAKPDPEQSQNAKIGGIPKSLRYAVFKRANFRCQCCGAKPTADNDVQLHIDHIVPQSLGGGHEFDNLQSLCSDCNLSKSNNHAYDHNLEVDLWQVH